ncbi:SDR family NAD(P)-dependent oxidoreductase [Actinomadura logoneensis]|uniref:SDR family NAD(P)-dependent oxidoreductase n=1 Tax=Actinomadura logoneensis TaxID=2293572 RepID=A0A372JAC8_9ACTN|nr:SDR family oxidoreductase [Actinomadura logoneensis]RFU36932.1 SDR family NAD(P)-dependent oxidoreductase [Actinomadura logoneensis]
MTTTNTLKGKVALVAGGTRGAGRGIATELGAMGATVYVTGRTTRAGRSEMDRPETIEETAERVTAAGGEGIPVRVDHLDPAQVTTLVERIDAEQGRLDVLVNDVWGGDRLFEFGKRLWEQDLDNGLRLLRLAVDTHLITSHRALPLLTRNPGGLVVEVTDGTAEFNAVYRAECGPFFDLAKWSVLRLAEAQAHEIGPLGGTAVSVTPGFLRSEAMLELFGVTEDNWRDAAKNEPAFAVSETPALVGRAVASIAADPDKARWNGRSLDSGFLAREYGFTDVDGSQPNVWPFVRRMRDGEDPGDPEDYR